MSNEKPGGHGERSVAVGTIDMAVWDAVAKIARKPLFRLLAERHGRNANPRVFVYAAGGYYYPGKGLSMLRGEMRGYLDRGYNVVKMKIGGAPIAEDRMRIEAVLEEIGKRGAARRRRQRPLRSRDGASPTPRCCATIRCSGSRQIEKGFGERGGIRRAGASRRGQSRDQRRGRSPAAGCAGGGRGNRCGDQAG